MGSSLQICTVNSERKTDLLNYKGDQILENLPFDTLVRLISSSIFPRKNKLWCEASQQESVIVPLPKKCKKFVKMFNNFFFKVCFCPKGRFSKIQSHILSYTVIFFYKILMCMELFTCSKKNVRCKVEI